MPRYDYNSMNVGLGAVAPRPIVRRNIEAFASALDKIDANSKEAIEKRSAIDMALSQIELNPAEDEWKYNYAKRIRDSIDAYARFGDYSQALNAATTAAATAVSSPEITGRIRAQAAYKQFVDQTKARNDISQDIKDWALALPENQYHYEDTYDSAYNIVGGSKWEAGKTPVSTVSRAEMLDYVKKWAAAESGGGVSDVGFVDANGQITSDFSKGVYGLAYKKSGTWTRLPESKLREAWNAVLNSMPGARASIQQDYDVALWKYNNMTPEERANNIDSDIADADGRIYSPEEYLENSIAPAFKAMSYYNSTSDIDFGDGLAKFYSARAASAAQNDLGLYDDMSAPGVPIEQDLTPAVNATYANLNGAINNLKSLYPNLSRTKAFANYIAKHDYNGLAKLLEQNMTSKDSAIREAARRSINILKDLGEEYNSYFDNLTQDDRYRFEFNSAIESNAPLPQNNPYTKSYNAHINAAFKGNTDGDTKYLGYVTGGINDFNAIAQGLGIKQPNNIQEWEDRGFIIDKYNDNYVIKFDKNNRYIPQLATQIMDSRTFLSHALGSTGFLRYDYNNRIMNQRTPFDRIQNSIVKFFGGNPDIDYQLEKIYTGGELTGIARDTNYQPGAGNIAYLAQTDTPGIDILASNVTIDGLNMHINPVQEARSKSLRILENKNMSTAVNETTQFESSFRDMDVERRVAMGQIDGAEATRLHTRYAKEDIPTLLAQGINGFNIFANNEDGTGTAKQLSQKDKDDVINQLYNAQMQGRLESGAWPHPLTGMYGTWFQIYPAKDKDGNLTGTPRTIYVEGLGNSKAAQQFAANTNTRAEVKLNNAKAIPNRKFTLVDGSTISNVSNTEAVITFANGEKAKVTIRQAKQALSASLGVEEARTALLSGQVTTTEQLKALAENIAYDAGHRPGDADYNAKVANYAQLILGNNTIQ